MELLDLPLEIFQNIIEDYVAETGIVKAWQSRLTCRAFADSITDEVFGKQPVASYLEGRAHRKLLANGILIYLQCRSSALYSAHDILPAIIRKSVDLFMQLTNNTSQASRREYLLAVSKAVTAHTRHKVLNLVVRPTDKMIRTYTADDDNQIALPIAVALGDVNLVRKIHDNGADLWKPAAAFGLPLRVALHTGNTTILDLVLNLSEEDHTTVSLKKRSSLISNEILYIWHRSQWSPNNEKILNRDLKKLITWFYSHLGRPTVQVGEVIMKWSVQTRKISLFKAALPFGMTEPLKRAYGHTFLDQITGLDSRSCTKYLEILLGNDMINTTENYFKPMYHNSLLSCAISTGDINLVRKALDIGCDPNGVLPEPAYYSHRTWPLGDAIRLGNVDIIQLLLERGADPDGYSSPGLGSGVVDHLLFLSAENEARTLLVIAICQKMARQGIDYEKPPQFIRYRHAIFDLVLNNEFPWTEIPRQIMLLPGINTTW